MQYISSTYNQQLYNAIFGFAIGDALGVPHEFQEQGNGLTLLKIGVKQYGRYFSKPGN